jgi:hypothetical protein
MFAPGIRALEAQSPKLLHQLIAGNRRQSLHRVSVRARGRSG